MVYIIYNKRFIKQLLHNDSGENYRFVDYFLDPVSQNI